MKWPFRKKRHQEEMSVIRGLSSLEYSASIILDGTKVHKNRGGVGGTDPKEVFNQLPLDNEHLIIVIKKEVLKRP